MSTDELGSLREALNELTADMREFKAEMRGSINTLGATKEGEHAVMKQEMRDTGYDLRTTKAALGNMQDFLAKFPRPEWYEGMAKSMSALEDKITEAVAVQAETLAGHGNTLQRHAEILDEQRAGHEDVHGRLGKVERKLDRVGWFITGAATAGGGAGAALARWLIGG